MSSMELIIRNLPRMTTVLNRAKRKTLEVLNELLQALSDGRQDANEACKVLDALLGDAPNDLIAKSDESVNAR
jgi:hypothetical protein